MRVLILISFLIASCTSTPEIFELDNPASDNGRFPRLFTDNTGTVFMSWMKTNGDSTQLFYSSLSDKIWSDPVLISASDSWFVNWADFPSVIAHDSEPVSAHWLQKKAGGTYSYDVTVTPLSVNSIQPFVPHSDETPTEHGFVSMIPLSASEYYAIWLDGRNTQGGHGHDDGHATDLSTAMTLRGALINGSDIRSEHQIDPSLCDCCNTSLVKTSSGLLAAYRDRTDEEIRDIYVSKYSIDSDSWSDPILVHNDGWQIAACPVNGPIMDAIDKTVATAWFTGADNEPKVKIAFSSDEGSTWNEAIVIDQDVPLGRVDVVLANESSAWVSWMTRLEEYAELKLARVSLDGKVLTQETISEIDPSRSTGFPQLTKTKAGLLIAWTDNSGEHPSIKTIAIQ